MICKRLRLPLMCLFSLSLLWSSLVNPQTRSSLTVLPGLSAVVSTGAQQLDCAMGVLKCSLTLNYLSRTSVLKESSMMRAKGNCSWVENVCYQLWKYILICFWWSIFFPQGRPMFRRESSGWCWVLSLPSSGFLLHNRRGFCRNMGWNIAALCSVSGSWFPASVLTNLWLLCFLLPLRCEPAHPADCQPPEHVFLLQTQFSSGPKKSLFSLG